MVAKKWKVDLDLGGNEIINGVFQNANVAPSNPRNGQFYYDLENNVIKVYQDDAWVTFATPSDLSTALDGKADTATTLAGYGITDAYTKTEVDTAIANIDALPSQSGNSGKFLTTDGTDASWAALPIATDQVAGIVKQGTNVTIANDGTISATVPVQSVNGSTGAVVVSSILDDNTKTDMLKIWVGTKQQYDAIVTKDAHTIYYIQKDGQAVDIYELLAAKQDKLNAGTNISLTPEQDGTVTIDNTYSLPAASDSTLGGVKVGTNLSIDGNGVLSATGAVASVNNKTGVVTLDKTDIGLGNVDNTADLDKPISTATQTALNAKADAATTLAGYGITDAYTKTEVDAKMVAAFHYKGNVATVGALPSSGNEVGDVYNVTSTGANYAWDGENWDKLSETIDLTPFLTITDAAATYETISNVSTLSGRVTTVEGKVNALEGKALTEKQIVTQDEALTPSGGVATWTITHTLGADVDVTIKEVATGEEIIADLTFSNNQIVVKMNVESTVAANTYKAVIIG